MAAEPLCPVDYRAFGLKPASEHELAYTEEELRVLLAESYKSGEIRKSELKYMNNIFTFDKRMAKEIMVPRNEMVSLSLDEDSIPNLQETVKQTKYTRYPVVREDKDNVIGVINMKEVLFSMLSKDFSLKNSKLNLSFSLLSMLLRQFLFINYC